MIEKIKEIISELKQTPFFKGLSQKHLSMLTNAASVEYYNKDDYVIKEGDIANKFYIVVSGQLDILTTEEPNHDHAIVLQSLNPHEVLGWSWIIPPNQWRFDAIATEAETKLLVFDGKQLSVNFIEDYSFGYELMYRFSFLLSMRLEMTRLKLHEVNDQLSSSIKKIQKLKKTT
jgi:CRP-like cAMP-binding protein